MPSSEAAVSAADPAAATVDPRIPALQAWSDDPSAVLALNEGTAAFATADVPGFIAHRRSGRWLVQVGGACAPADARPVLIDRFRAFAAAQGCRVVAVQLQRAAAEEHAAAGRTVNQIGASYALETSSFTLRGKQFVSLRNKISRARRAGVTVETTTVGQLAAPDARALAALDAEWLRAKGRFARPLHFLVGELGGPGAELRRLVLARLGGEVVGYVSLSPVYGSRPGWLHDLSRRGSHAPPGVMELLVNDCLERSAAEQDWWHFGFTPFTSLHGRSELPGASRVVGALVRLLADHGSRIYPAATQLDYKRKWGELERLPDYLAFDGRPSPGGVVQLLRVTNLI